MIPRLLCLYLSLVDDKSLIRQYATATNQILAILFAFRQHCRQDYIILWKSSSTRPYMWKICAMQNKAKVPTSQRHLWRRRKYLAILSLCIRLLSVIKYEYAICAIFQFKSRWFIYKHIGSLILQFIPV
jgi:hypothetical protein